MVLRHVWLIPVAAVSCLLIAMLSGYIIGVAKDQLPALLPFISDGGKFLPGAAIFAQFLNMAAFLMIIMFYIRHRQIVEYYGYRLNMERTLWWQISFLLMWIGFIGAVGVMFVANFRMSEVAVMHGIGAFLVFIAILVYGWGHVIFSYKLTPRMTPKNVNILRLILMILATLLVILHELAVVFHLFVPKSAGDPPKDWPHIIWFPKDSPFYRNYLIATSAEWATMLILLVFFLTFVVELRFAHAHPPRVQFRRNADDNEGQGNWLDTHHNVRITQTNTTHHILTGW